MIDAFPLEWPIGYRRTKNRITSKFKQTMEQSQRFLRDEIKRLGGTGLIVSTNIPVRKDGGLYSDYMSRRLDDPGVAIFFRYDEKDITMCCDQYERVWENIYALGKGIESIRGMERWGISEFLERAFTGFKALPETTAAVAISWWNILEVAPDATSHQIRDNFLNLSKRYHPDNQETGNAEKFIQIKSAYDQAMSLRQ